MKLKLILVFLLPMFLFFSCEKEDTDNLKPALTSFNQKILGYLTDNSDPENNPPQISSPFFLPFNLSNTKSSSPNLESSQLTKFKISNYHPAKPASKAWSQRSSKLLNCESRPFMIS